MESRDKDAKDFAAALARERLRVNAPVEEPKKIVVDEPEYVDLTEQHEFAKEKLSAEEILEKAGFYSLDVQGQRAYRAIKGANAEVVEAFRDRLHALVDEVCDSMQGRLKQ